MNFWLGVGYFGASVEVQMKGILYWFHFRVKLIWTCHKDAKISLVPQQTSIGCSSLKFKHYL